LDPGLAVQTRPVGIVALGWGCSGGLRIATVGHFAGAVPRLIAAEPETGHLMLAETRAPCGWWRWTARLELDRAC